LLVARSGHGFVPFGIWDNGGLYAATLADVEDGVKYKVHV
jgi:hypothetical protein